MKKGRFRSTLVMVSTGQETQFYKKLKDVPAPLKRELDRATKGPLAAYIVIADRKGRHKLHDNGSVS